MNHGQQHEHETGARDSRGKWVFIGFLLIAGYFLWAEHRAHLMGVLPYLLILACPLMHLFHHRHGHRRHTAQDADANREAPSAIDRS